MTRLAPLALALLLGLASTPTADAQLGRLLNRAREAVSGTAEEASAAAQQATTAVTSRTPSPDDPSPATLDGRPAPIMDYLSMLNTGYVLRQGYWDDGPGNHYFTFYPEREAEVIWTVTDADGRTVYAEDSYFSRTGDPTFSTISSPRLMSPSNSGPAATEGDFALNVLVNGRLMGHIPYTVQAVQAGDVYDSYIEYSRTDGPWARLGYFTHSVRRPSEALEFHGWLTASDVPTGETKVRVTLYREGEPVATCGERRCPRVHALRNDWAPVKTPLIRSGSIQGPNAEPFAITDVTSGSYEVKVTGYESGTLIRSYMLTGTDGAFQEHPRSAMSYEPRYDHLSPRTVRSANGSLTFNQTFWMETAE